AAEPGCVVLGREYRPGAPCRRPCAADHADHDPLVRRLPDPAAVRLAASEARLAGAARPPAADAVPVGDRIRLQQRNFLLGTAIYPGAERAVDPVVRAAVRGAVVA